MKRLALRVNYSKSGRMLVRLAYAIFWVTLANAVILVASRH